MVNQDTENHFYKIKYGSLTLEDLSMGFHVWKANPSAKHSLIAISVDFLTYGDEVRFTGELPIFAASPLNEFIGTPHISRWQPVHM